MLIGHEGPGWQPRFGPFGNGWQPPGVPDLRIVLVQYVLHICKWHMFLMHVLLKKYK